MRPPVVALAAALLAGCAPHVPTATDPAAAPPGPARGEAGFVVRTFAPTPGGRELEVGGVACAATAEGFHARFRSPARVLVPDPQPGEPVRVRCAGGGLSGEALALPRPAYAHRGAAVWPALGVTVASGGRVGVGLGAHVTPRTVPTGGVAYDDVRVRLR